MMVAIDVFLVGQRNGALEDDMAADKHGRLLKSTSVFPKDWAATCLAGGYEEHRGS